jgi:hypothetical protein
MGKKDMETSDMIDFVFESKKNEWETWRNRNILTV